MKENRKLSKGDFYSRMAVHMIQQLTFRSIQSYSKTFNKAASIRNILINDNVGQRLELDDIDNIREFLVSEVNIEER